MELIPLFYGPACTTTDPEGCEYYRPANIQSQPDSQRPAIRSSTVAGAILRWGQQICLQPNIDLCRSAAQCARAMRTPTPGLGESVRHKREGHHSIVTFPQGGHSTIRRYRLVPGHSIVVARRRTFCQTRPGSALSWLSSSRLNAGRSSGLRLVTQLPSTITSRSCHRPPALRTSSWSV